MSVAGRPDWNGPPPPRPPPDMARTDLFLQQCADGGRRLGLTVDRQTLWYEYDPVWENPVLMFAIDLTAEGAAVPTGADAVKAWYLDAADDFREMLAEAADLLTGGDAAGEWPEWPLTRRRAADGAELGVNVHATYGFGLPNLVAEMEAFAGQLESRVAGLPRYDRDAYDRARSAWLERSRLKAAA